MNDDLVKPGEIERILLIHVLRLSSLLLQSDHALFVAERLDGHLLGLVHVYRCFLVHTDPEAQIGGLVVGLAPVRAMDMV